MPIKPKISAKTPEEIVKFASWLDAYEYACREPKVLLRDASSRDASKDDWASPSGKNASEGSFKLAKKLMAEGWEDAGKTAVKLSSAVFEKMSHKVEREHMVWDVSGMGFDAGLALSGEPEYWYSLENRMEDAPDKVIKLVFNGSFSGGIGAETIMARGAAVTALVQLLEYSGCRVEVEWWTLFDNGTKKISFVTPLKRADEELNVSRLAFALGHPASLRRMGFSMCEQHPDVHCLWYGFPREVSPEQQGNIYIPSMAYGDARWTSAEKTEEWLLENLKTQGVKVS